MSTHPRRIRGAVLDAQNTAEKMYELLVGLIPGGPLPSVVNTAKDLQMIPEGYHIPLRSECISLAARCILLAAAYDAEAEAEEEKQP